MAKGTAAEALLSPQITPIDSLPKEVLVTLRLHVPPTGRSFDPSWRAPLCPGFKVRGNLAEATSLRGGSLEVHNALCIIGRWSQS
jgi:hypothetical protein